MHPRHTVQYRYPVGINNLNLEDTQDQYLQFGDRGGCSESARGLSMIPELGYIFAPDIEKCRYVA